MRTSEVFKQIQEAMFETETRPRAAWRALSKLGIVPKAKSIVKAEHIAWGILCAVAAPTSAYSKILAWVGEVKKYIDHCSESGDATAFHALVAALESPAIAERIQAIGVERNTLVCFVVGTNGVNQALTKKGLVPQPGKVPNVIMIPGKFLYKLATALQEDNISYN